MIHRAKYLLLICIICLGLSHESLAVSYFAPSGPGTWRMQDAGLLIDFDESADDSTVLIGEDHWAAEHEGARILALTQDEKKGRLFCNGTLVRRLENGHESNPGKNVVSTNELASLWQVESLKERYKIIPNIWSQGRRLRLWYKNPNVAAMLLVEFAFLSIWLCLMRPWYCRVLGGLLFFASLVGLFATESRGGFLALTVGVMAMASLRLRQLITWKTLIVVLFILGGVGVWTCVKGVPARYTTALLQQDEKNDRLALWSSVPALMAASPISGVGHGESGRAVVEWWMEKPTCLLRDLIGSHQTFLVEFNLVERIIYLLSWVVILILALMSAMRGGKIAPLGLFSALFVGAVFNPVLGEPTMLLIPLPVAGYLLFAGRDWLRKYRFWVAALTLVALVLGPLYAIGAWSLERHSEIPVFETNRILIRDSHPFIWVVDDDYTLHGGRWWLTGGEIRRYYRKNPTAAGFGYIRNLEDIPRNPGRLVLVGSQVSAYCRQILQENKRLDVPSELVLISPDCGVKAIADCFRGYPNVKIVRGSLVVPSEKFDTLPPQFSLQEVKGCALYIPNWLEFVAKQKEKNNEDD